MKKNLREEKLRSSLRSEEGTEGIRGNEDLSDMMADGYLWKLVWQPQRLKKMFAQSTSVGKVFALQGIKEIPGYLYRGAFSYKQAIITHTEILQHWKMLLLSSVFLVWKTKIWI